jgi:hypothetical protein
MLFLSRIVWLTVITYLDKRDINACFAVFTQDSLPHLFLYTYNKGMRLLFILCLIFQALDASAQAPKGLLQAVSKLAAEEDRKYADGWFFGQLPRVFKSGYGKLSCDLKAKFALDYESMLLKRKQDLVSNFNSYVPYNLRLVFAREWWKNADQKGWCKFVSLSDKEKLIWLHESILDGSELAFRAREKLDPDKINSYAVLAHDKEQDMVAHYTHENGKVSTFSKTYSEWKGKL